MHQLTLSLRCKYCNIHSCSILPDAINSKRRLAASDCKPMTSVFYDVIRLESADARTCLWEAILTVFGEFEPKMLSAIVWTPNRHFLTSHRVFWDISREIPCTGCFSRRVRGKIKIKKRGLIFRVFRQALPYGRLAQILWGVEVWPFPLDCDIAVNTVWTTVQFWFPCSSRGRNQLCKVLS